MKKLFSLILLCTACMFIFSSCSKEDGEDFDYPMETLYGTWEGTDMKVKDTWIDLTNILYSKFSFSITFHSDGTYYGKGYFGNGDGTYKAIGNMIYTYVDGEEYYSYKIKSLDNNKAELLMGVTGSDDWIEIKVEKK